MFAPLLALAFSFPFSAEPLADGGYKLPPREIVELLDAAPTPSAQISPQGEWMLLVERAAMPSIAEVTREWIPLAGRRVDPKLNTTQVTSFAHSLSVLSIADGDEVKIELPAGARIVDARWSPARALVAFSLAGDDGLELWIADGRSGVARKLASGLNGVLGASYAWASDGERLIVRLVPKGRAAAPARVEVPTGPAIQETSGAKTALRTYQDLLRDAHDEALFDHYATSQIALVDPRADAITPIGAPGVIADVDMSPDGQHWLVSRVHRPYSYVLPAGLFPTTIEVWDANGKLERVIAEVPMGDKIPQEGVELGPRNVTWHAARPATLVWCEALDGGDPKTKSEWRDRWMLLAAPFGKQSEAREFTRLHQRAQGLQFLDENRAFVTEYDRDRRWMRQLLVDLLHADAEGIVFDDRNVNDRYKDPGSFVSQTSERGTRVVRQSGGMVFRTGSGASPEGERPFLDRVELATRKTERLWQCEAGSYESTVAFVSSRAGEKPTIVTSFETPTQTPNFRVRDLEHGTMRALTSFPDPQPALRGVKQELVKYKRADGVDLSATLYLPPDWKPGTRLPLFVWAYPLEYTDAGTAGQVSGSPSRFVRVRGASQLLFALHGWAVLDNAAMPVVGDPETMNDTFLAQVVSSAQAAIDFAVERGVADRERVAVGGHSYGAFMTANLLAHCNLFKAGVARSGAYNRTLTPFGFQSERRTIWEAPSSYIQLSPFMAADKIDEPLLMIHGEKDNNQGTFPIQSERLFQAVKGNGGTARLVMLPGEAHGYAARESNLHVVAEMFEWCDRFVRDAQPVERGAGFGGVTGVEGQVSLGERAAPRVDTARARAVLDWNRSMLRIDPR